MEKRVTVAKLLDIISDHTQDKFILGDSDFPHIDMINCYSLNVRINDMIKFLYIEEAENTVGYDEDDYDFSTFDLLYKIEKYICLHGKNIIHKINEARETQLTSLTRCDELSMPVFNFSLTIDDKVLLIYPIHFSTLIDEISILRDPLVVEEHSIKIELPDNIKSNLKYDTVRFLFKFVYSFKLPAQIDLIELIDIKEQLKLLVLLCDYLGIKYYPQFFDGLDKHLSSTKQNKSKK